MPAALILLGDKTTHQGTAAYASQQGVSGGRTRCGATPIARQQNLPVAV